MQAKHRTLTALEELRTGILSGERIELPSSQRQHLELGSPIISEVSYDVRHRPVSSNVTRHFQHLRTLAPDIEIRFHAFMPLKRPTASAAQISPGPSALLVAIDSTSKLLVMDPDMKGRALLGPIDLGHGPKRTVTLLATSSSHESHLVLTADDGGTVRVHSLRVVARRENRTKLGDEDGDNESFKPRMLNVTANFSCRFSLPKELSNGPEVPQLTSLLPLERSEKPYFVTGDSLGGIAVFFHNGTLKGRVRVTEDHGGVRGLLKGQSHLVVFFSSHSFGSFSASQIDVQTPPCSGWNSPVYDVVLDPGYQSSRVILALTDGDVIVFSTTRGKSKACDLTLKFPHVSAVPFKLQVFRGHIMALTSPTTDTERRGDYLREIYFFNLAAMDNGYGASPSRTVTVQASFKPLQPESVAISGDRSKSQIAIRFAGKKGLEMYSLNIKLPAALQAVMGNVLNVNDGSDEPTWGSTLMSWLPKAGVFGLVLTGVVVWNIRKANRGNDEYDEAFFQEQLRKAQASVEKEQQQKGTKQGPGSGSRIGANSRTRIEEVDDND